MPNEEETLPLMVKVVEYLESSMSKDLLCKFPDNSAFDFDYTQSSIWSPLLPRPTPPVRELQLSRKLSYSCKSDFRAGLFENTKRIATTIKKKFTGAVLENVIPVCHGSKKRKRRKSFGIPPVSSSYSPSPKAWGNLMKAASKRFKKRKIKKRDHEVHFDVSNYLKDEIENPVT